MEVSPDAVHVALAIAEDRGGGARPERCRPSELRRGRIRRPSTGSPGTSGVWETHRCFRALTPGQLRAALPTSPPESGESFRDLLGELDRVLFPGSPTGRVLASSRTSRRPVRHRVCSRTCSIAGLNNVGILWRASPALQELEETVLDWLAQLLALPTGLHGHLEEGASISTLAALAAARQAEAGQPSRRVL